MLNCNGRGIIVGCTQNTAVKTIFVVCSFGDGNIRRFSIAYFHGEDVFCAIFGDAFSSNGQLYLAVQLTNYTAVKVASLIQRGGCLSGNLDIRNAKQACLGVIGCSSSQQANKPADGGVSGTQNLESTFHGYVGQRAVPGCHQAAHDAAKAYPQIAVHGGVIQGQRGEIDIFNVQLRLIHRSDDAAHAVCNALIIGTVPVHAIILGAGGCQRDARSGAALNGNGICIAEANEATKNGAGFYGDTGYIAAFYGDAGGLPKGSTSTVNFCNRRAAIANQAACHQGVGDNAAAGRYILNGDAGTGLAIDQRTCQHTGANHGALVSAMKNRCYVVSSVAYTQIGSSRQIQVLNDHVLSGVQHREKANAHGCPVHILPIWFRAVLRKGDGAVATVDFGDKGVGG